jgi:hypothetical protein
MYTRTILSLLSLVALANLVACVSSDDEQLDDTAEAPLRQARGSAAATAPMVLLVGDGSACRISPGANTEANALLRELVTASQPSAAAELLQAPIARAEPPNAAELDTCEPELQDWALRSFERRQLAPYDVASLRIPRMSELRLFLSGGGILAGLMGDGVGAACMGTISAGIEYAQSRGWVTCER